MIALYPGTFDPPTVGHQEVIRRAAKLFERVVVGVLVNRNKRPVLAAQARVELLQKCAGPLDNVAYVAYEGMLSDLVRQVGAHAVLRGIRGEADCALERPVAEGLRALYGVETLFLPADPATAFVSSSMAREVMAFGRPPDGLVPGEILQEVAQAFAHQGYQSGRG